MFASVRLQAAWRGVLILLLPLLVLPLVGAIPSAPTAANDWRVNNIVYLSKGTQIWTAPSFSSPSCYHTIVPEDNWAVMVINGPRNAEGRTWYDTSRAAAGDPSGGTGWVNTLQADASPATRDNGIYCPPGTSTTTPKKVNIQLPGFLTDIKEWWEKEPLPVKIGVLVIALILLFTSARWASGGGPIVTTLVRAILWGVLLAGVADLTRPSWISTWYQITSGNQYISSAIDPALLLLVAPLIIYGVILLFGMASRLVSIVVTILLGLFLLTLLTPDRISSLINGFLNLFGGGSKP